MKHFYHIFANGDDSKEFIVSKEDFNAAFNRIGICVWNTGIVMLAFNIEESHPHFLVYAEEDEAYDFTEKYTSSTSHYIVRTRGSLDGVCFNLNMYEITDQLYLRRTGAYTIVQSTKDGKRVMPYDYPWGTGCMYFRSPGVIFPWWMDTKNNCTHPSIPFGELGSKEKEHVLHSKMRIPDDWIICNGLIVPENYINVSAFESIYQTHNCFRTFLSAGQKQEDPIVSKMSEIRGVNLEDLEARKLAEEHCLRLFSRKTARHLNTAERLLLARELRRKYQISFRQLATLCRLPEAEIRKYVR